MSFHEFRTRYQYKGTALNDTNVILDECHELFNEKLKNREEIYKLLSESTGRKVFTLSGTPWRNTDEMVRQLALLHTQNRDYIRSLCGNAADFVPQLVELEFVLGRRLQRAATQRGVFLFCSALEFVATCWTSHRPPPAVWRRVRAHARGLMTSVRLCGRPKAWPRECGKRQGREARGNGAQGSGWRCSHEPARLDRSTWT